MKALDRDDPREIGGYRILRILGAGGMGRVYLARSPGGRTVAVKVIRPELADDPGFRHLFRREVAAARRVGGAWTAPVIDADTESARPWLVTGYVAGPSVFEAVDRHGPLPEASVRTLGAGLAEALIAIHGTGLIHRDLKPTNVLLSLDGPRVIDFGISRALDASVHTRTGATVGSPGFMSPEQIDGRDVGHATDVFSLGSVLVFAATAEGPFGAGNGQALMFRIVSKTPELGAVPPSLRDLISSCLAKFAGNRPTPQELLAHLAPDGGTAALIAPGWLPGPLTTDLSRRAIALLEIDELAPHTDPVGHGTPGGNAALPTAPTQPPSAYAPTEPPSQPYSSYPAYPLHVAPSYSTTGPPPMPAAPPSARPGPPATPPMPSRAPVYADHTDSAPGAAFAPEASYRTPEAFRGFPESSIGSMKTGRRRGTWWLLLSAVAGAIAIVSTSALIARSESDGSSRGSSPQSDISAPGTPTAPASGTGTSGGTPGPSGTGAPPSGGNAATPGKIPDDYVGTWTGTITSQSGTTTSSLTITLHQADARGIVGSSISHAGGELVKGDCTSDSKFVTFGGDGLLLQDVANDKPQPTLNGFKVCATGGQILLRLDAPGSDKATVEIIATESGNPTGTLRRTT